VQFLFLTLSLLEGPITYQYQEQGRIGRSHYYIIMLLWLEYNYRHALELSKVPRLLISEKPFFNDADLFHFIPKRT